MAVGMCADAEVRNWAV
jgi:hypothetical protein